MNSKTTREDLIAQYRKLGTAMKDLRTSHLNDIDKLIVEYKKAKAELQKQRFELLTQIRKPTEKAADEPAEISEVA